MQKEQIQEFTSKITLSNRSGLTVVTYEILFAYLTDAKKALKEEHAPLKTLSVNISQLYDGIVDVQDRLNNTNRGENK